LLQCELQMLQALNFEINIPLPHHFLDRGILACGDLTLDGKTKVELICRYLFELILTESSTVGISAFVKCAAGLYLSRELLRLKCERDVSRGHENPLNANGNNILLDPSKKLETWPESIGQIMGQESLVKLLPMVLIYIQKVIKYLPNSDIEEAEYVGAFQKYSNRNYGKIALSDIILEADYDLIVRDIDEKLAIDSDPL
uniref:Cyclin C-terminal domain-containing protein n=1 Tax=Trichobilharzia regenti TaxID=157069 RepID=A0AA85J9R1_TRIRE